MLLIFNEHHNMKHYHHLMVFIFEKKKLKEKYEFIIYRLYIIYSIAI